MLAPGGAGIEISASREKVAAKRREASRSTGPRTAQGRGVSSRNATHHGLLFDPQTAAQIVRQVADIGDVVADCPDIRERFSEELSVSQSERRSFSQRSRR